MIQNVWLIPAFPLAAFLVNGFFGRRSVMATIISPERYFPVSEAGVAMRSATLPCATTWPPWMPAPGPMSST